MQGREELKQTLGTAIVVSGPSGVGKSTLCKRVREAYPELGFSISCTTRPPRAGETDGVEYFFLNREEFDRRVAAGEFAEHARVFANSYGTLKSQLLDPVRGLHDVFLDIDVQGAMQIREACRQDAELSSACEFIFIAPPSLAVLEKRLRDRNTDSAEQLALRLGQARNELSFAGRYDYIVVNDDLDTAARELINLIATFKLSSKRRRLEENL